MSLRDELLNQQKEQAQKEKARKKEQQSEQEQSEQNFKMQRERLQKQAEAAYETLENRSERAIFPKNGTVSTTNTWKNQVTYPCGQPYFQFQRYRYAKVLRRKGVGLQGEKQRCNAYERIPHKTVEKDGFASAKFCLTDEVSYYATEWDIANQQAEQERKNAKAYEDYDRDWNNWYNNDTGGRAPSQSDYVPKQAKLKKRERSTITALLSVAACTAKVAVK